MDEFSFVQSYLSGGEYVLWQGKPGKVRLLDPFYLSTALFAIPWLAFCGYWEYMAIRSGGKAVAYADRMPGDVICYSGHVAIYIGNNTIVHASNEKPYPAGGIKTSSIGYRTVLAVRRYW